VLSFEQLVLFFFVVEYSTISNGIFEIILEFIGQVYEILEIFSCDLPLVYHCFLFCSSLENNTRINIECYFYSILLAHLYLFLLRTKTKFKMNSSSVSLANFLYTLFYLYSEIRTQWALNLLVLPLLLYY